MAQATRRKYAPRLPRAERREQLLDAALGVIAESGLDALTMESVARGAGVTKPVLYELFPNRGELLSALLEREEQRALQQMAAVMPATLAGRAPDELFGETVEAFLQAVSERPVSWRILLLPSEGTPAEIRERFERVRAQILLQARFLAEWGVGHRAAGTLDPELLAHLMVNSAEFLARLALSDPERYTPERLSDFARQVAGSVINAPS